MGSRRWASEESGEVGPLEQLVGEELAELGWRSDTPGALATLGQQALHLAENIDQAGGSSGYYVPALNKELRETMAAAREASGVVAGGEKPTALREEAEVDDFTARRAGRRRPGSAAGG